MEYSSHQTNKENFGHCLDHLNSNQVEIMFEACTAVMFEAITTVIMPISLKVL